ncbi:MAG: hypothetical protein CEE38_16915 [Planctomycetes bacterium B3_Pla]|nr:MAG: hypothetical protein CEE38_16915 [Planctomycetes bacterium B3_Pla]
MQHDMLDTRQEVIMPLHVRSIAVSIAVVCFFVVSLIGWGSGLTPFVCCKRALIGATLAYIAGGWAVKAVNAILINAMIANQMNQQDGSDIGVNREAGSGESDSGGTG